MPTYALHSTVTAPPQRAELMGMEGWRIPATLVREQVLHNNVGRMYLSEEEIAASAHRWNMMPVTLGHPRHRGRPVSAKHEAVIDEVGLGWVLNADVDGGELKADVFLPDHRVEQLGLEEEIVHRVDNGEPVEVSTSFDGDFHEETGAFDNQRYDVVAEDIEPDHFALLLDEEGACSVEDGCGLGVNARSTSRTRGDLAGSGEVAEGEVPGWWPAGLERYVDTLDLEPQVDADSIEEGGDLSEDQRSRIAAHTLLGEGSAETLEDLLVFPVVNPETGEIEEGALRAVIGGRGAQADISDGALQSARGAARSILEDEGLLESEDDEEAENADADTIVERVVAAVRSAFGPDGGEGVPAGNQEDEFSLDDRREALRGEIETLAGGPNVFTHIVEMFEDAVVYAVDPQGGEQQLFRADYEVDEAAREVTLGEREEVEKVVEFVPVENGVTRRVTYLSTAPPEDATVAAVQQFQPRADELAVNTVFRAHTPDEDRTMERDELIDALADNEDAPFRRETLEAMDDEELEAAANAADLEFGDGADGDDDGDAGEPEDSGSADNADGTEPPAWAENLTEQVEEVSDRLATLEEETAPVREDQEEQKAALREQIADNSSFTEEELEGKPLAELEKIHGLTRPVDYSGLGGPSRNRSGSEEDLGFETNSVLAGNRGESVLDGDE